MRRVNEISVGETKKPKPDNGNKSKGIDKEHPQATQTTKRLSGNKCKKAAPKQKNLSTLTFAQGSGRSELHFTLLIMQIQFNHQSRPP